MRSFRYLAACIVIFTVTLAGCEEIETFPNEPSISFKKHTTYLTTDDLGKVAIVKLEIEFTDGDGDIGMKQPDYDTEVDSLKYNLFMTLYDYRGNGFEKVEGAAGKLNYRIPYINREGQNKTLKGTIEVDLEFKIIPHDTIFYSFYMVDRKFHKSNVDSSDVIILTGIDL